MLCQHLGLSKPLNLVPLELIWCPHGWFGLQLCSEFLGCRNSSVLVKWVDYRCAPRSGPVRFESRRGPKLAQKKKRTAHVPAYFNLNPLTVHFAVSSWFDASGSGFHLHEASRLLMELCNITHIDPRHLALCCFPLSIVIIDGCFSRLCSGMCMSSHHLHPMAMFSVKAGSSVPYM